VGGNERRRAECLAVGEVKAGETKILFGARRAAEQYNPLAGRRAQWRCLGGDAGRVEPHSRKRGGFVYFGGRIAGRFHSFAAGGWRRFAVDRHAARTDTLDGIEERNAGAGADGDFYASQRPGKRPGGRNGARYTRRSVVATLNGLSRLSGGRIVNYTTANGLSSNVITALLPRADGSLLIGTQDRGWNLWDGQRFSAESSGGLSQTGIHAILDDGIGHLWFATGNGIARCESDGKAVCSHWIDFGAADGLRSRETATNSHPSAWRSRDGHLWFATPKGLVEIDPAHFPVNAIAPPVALERFAVDDVAQALRAAGSLLRIEAGHVHFQFDYAG